MSDNSEQDNFKDLIKNNKDFKELPDDKINPFDNIQKADHPATDSKPSNSNKNLTEENYNKYLHDHEDFNLSYKLSHHLWRPLVGSDEYLFYFKTGVQNRTVRKFRAGKIRVESTLDLHQKNKEQAAESLIQFIKNAYNNEQRCVCIIHGKSIRAGATHPILKNLLNHWLHEIEPVLGFCSCPVNLGGTGAVLVLLKRNYE